MELVAATRNTKKLGELRRILADLPIELRGLDQFPACHEVEETGNTFEENALLKARAVAATTGLPALADDSGLVVDALAGAPGVRSARFAGDAATDGANVEKLLRELQGMAHAERTARFVCVVALAWPDGRAETFTGAVEGTLGREPRGKNGFGYDPLFLPEGHGRTFAQMSASEKDSLSHRGRALKKVRDRLEGL